jgi:hypothetical protein
MMLKLSEKHFTSKKNILGTVNRRGNYGGGGEELKAG